MDRKVFTFMQEVFKKLGIVERSTLQKLEKINRKLPADEHEEPKLCDYVITENSLKEGFESVFGAKCDIFATLLYINGSHKRDFCKLNLIEFYDLFKPLLVSRFTF